MQPIVARLRPCLPALLLALLVALLYGHTLHVPWYMDDQDAIVLNPQVSDPGLAVGELFSPRGVAYLSFALNYRLAGFSLPAFHLVNILIHLACGGLVLLLLRRVFRDDPFWPLCGALLFVAHPVQTQAVTYIVQRMTSLSALFFFLALYLFVRAREVLATGVALRSARYLVIYFGSLAAGALAVGAKENAVVLPVALLLFSRAFLPEERSWRPLLLAVLPFTLAPLALAVLMLGVPLGRGASLAAMGSTIPLSNLAGSTPLRYLLTEFSVIWIYLRLLLLPYGQALDYGYPVVRTLTVQTVAAAAGLLTLGGLGWRWRAARPSLAFGIGWFFLTLAVESSVIPLDPYNEHRLYLPLFGFLVVFLDLVRCWPRRLAQAVLLLALGACALLTWQRNALWNDPLALFAADLRHAPVNERMLNNLAAEYFMAGQDARAEALARQAVALNPRYPGSYLNLGVIFAALGRWPEAEQSYRAALALGGDELLLHLHLARLLRKEGRLQEALAEYTLTLLLAPTRDDLRHEAEQVARQLGQKID